VALVWSYLIELFDSNYKNRKLFNATYCFM
jgi:hypothetical protein